VSAVNLLFLAVVGLLIPALSVRNARRTRAVVRATDRPAELHLRLLLLPALYLPVTIAAAVQDELPWPRADEITTVVVLTALAWLAGKLLIVQLFKPWLRRHTGPVVSRLAPRLSPPSLLVFAVVCVVIGTAEELAFRWVFPSVLRSAGLPMPGAFLSASVIFALWHAAQGPRGMLFAGFGGFVNHLLVYGTDTLWTPILSHIAYDFVAGVLIAWKDGRLRQVGASPMQECHK
jgi:membrane protease YdiL (CAAX protease family)